MLDAELLGEANRHIDWLIDKHPDLRTERLGHWLVADDPFWLRLIGDDRLLDVAEQLIGPDIALFAAAYVVKRPGTGGRFAWHQDGSYWPLEPMEVATLWVACSASNRAGCIEQFPVAHPRPADRADRTHFVCSVETAGKTPIKVFVEQDADQGVRSRGVVSSASARA